MPANTAPIFSRTPNNGWTAPALTTANTAMDGTGTVSTVFTAGADGGYVAQLRAKAAGTNIATVLRVFVNNGSTNSTAANNILVSEFSLPATTASATAATPDVVIPLNLPLPATHRIHVTIGTTVASGWHVSAHGGSY